MSELSWARGGGYSKERKREQERLGPREQQYRNTQYFLGKSWWFCASRSMIVDPEQDLIPVNVQQPSQGVLRLSPGKGEGVLETAEAGERHGHI